MLILYVGGGLNDRVNNKENRINGIINGQTYYMLPDMSRHIRVIFGLTYEIIKFFPDKKYQLLNV